MVFENLFAKFLLRQESEDLKAEFSVGQDSEDLFAYFTTSTVVGTPSELFCKFAVRRIYDLSDQGGIGFFWKGVDRGQVDVQILTPTGAWNGQFSESENWQFVELWWEDLEEVDIDGSRPDKTQITGFLWTYHSAGIRHLDGLYGLPKKPSDVKGIMVIRHADYNELPATFYLPLNLFGEFIVKQSAAADLHAEFLLRQETEDLHGFFHVGQDSVDLKAEFFSQYRFKDLKGVFTVLQGTVDLKAEFVIGPMIETYGAVGTGNDTINLTTYTDIEGMTVTINDVEAGDEIIIMFDSSVDPNAQGSGNYEFYFRAIYDLGVGEVAVGNEVRGSIQYNGYNQHEGFQRRLVAPSNGDYTFKIQWKRGTSTYTLTSELRDMIVMHIH